MVYISIIVIELIYEKILGGGGGVKLTPSLNMTSNNPVLLGLMLYISYKHSIFACVCGGKVVGVCACGCGGGSIMQYCRLFLVKNQSVDDWRNLRQYYLCDCQLQYIFSFGGGGGGVVVVNQPGVEKWTCAPWHVPFSKHL